MGWTCAVCRGENPPPTRFCGWCGSPRDALEPPTEETQEAVETLTSALERKEDVEDERRLVTALFADISGFTTLADALDADSLHEIISPVIGRLAAVAERYDGFIAKFAGDALLVFFGAPTTHEDDADRALLVAIEMHEELRRTLDDLPEDARHLQLHIGVNSGRVVSGLFGGESHSDYSILGDAVNLAQRLESVAPAGETYVGELTHQLTRERFEFEDLGELTLKGKPRPIAAWRLVGPRASGPATGDRRKMAMFGRDDELARIGAVLDSVGRGGSGVIGVVGEPGVGKSRLLTAARERAEAGGIEWLSARSTSYGASLPYWPITDLIRRSFGLRLEDAEDVQRARLLEELSEAGIGATAPFLERLVGIQSGEGALAQLDPEAFRHGLHEAIASWLRSRSSRSPVVLAIEDVHWADASTLELARDLRRSLADSAVAFYLTARPEGGTTIEEIAGEPPFELGPLSDEAIRSLVAWVLEGEPPPELVEAVPSRAGGNPFFAEELTRSLIDAGTLERDDGRWQLREGWSAEALPLTVERVLASRIDLLPRDAAGVLQTASVIGRRVRVPLLREVTTREDLDSSLRTLVDSAFLDPLPADDEAEFMFHHALILEAAYSRLVRRRRRELHLQLADAGARLYGTGDEVVDLLARHLYLGEAGGRAVEFLVRAGTRARRLFANDEALLHLGRAAEVSRKEPSCADVLPGVLLDLADLNDLVGRYDDSLELYEEVRSSTNDAKAWRGAAAILRKRGQYDDALRLISDAFESCSVSGPEQAPLWLERGWTLGLSGRYRDGIDAMHSGLASLDEDGARGDGSDARVRAQLLLQLARAEIVEGQPRDALTHALQAQEILEELGDLRELAVTMRIVGDADVHLDRLDDAASALRRGIELAERVGSVEEMAACLANLGIVEWRRGRLDDAITVTQRSAEEAAGIGHASGLSTAYANLAGYLLERGDLDEALEYCRKALEIAEEIGYTMTVADVHLILGQIRMRQGDLDEAGREARESARLFLEIGAPGMAAEGYDLEAETVERAGDAERAADLRRQARSLSASSN